MVHSDGVAVIVRGVVSERAQGKRVFIERSGIAEQGQDEIAAADVVQEVAEEMAVVRVIAEVLNDGAAVGVSFGFAQLVGCGVGKAREKQRLDRRLPRGIDNGFVRENGIGARLRREQRQQDEKCGQCE